ncbi:unannotated protein [freshwater metagenome]|uniref:Unannotated protein n=1 Tax=freshwater metagenome TaxID=449393 RepID=A0A6J6KH82_9ZZZZ
MFSTSIAMISSARSSIASAIFSNARWRVEGVESRQCAKASSAALNAASTSAAFDLGAVAKAVPVAGLIRVVDSPDFDSTDFPLMKLLSFFMGRA